MACGVSVGRVDYAFDCTGIESCVQASIYATDNGGKVVLVVMGTSIQSWHIAEITGREIDIVTVWRHAHCYPRAIEIMEGVRCGTIGPNFTKLITHRFSSLGSMPAAYATASRTQDENSNLIIKAVVNI